MKMWEMIKELTENPKKKFRIVDGSNTGSYVTVEDNIAVWRGSNNHGQPLRVVAGCRDYKEWEEVKEPVTWKEAFQAGLEGKKIKPEGQYLSFPDYADLLYVFKYLLERPGYFEKVMMDKWYIKD